MKKKLLAALLATIGVSAYAAEDTKALSGFYVETGPLYATTKDGPISFSNTLVQVVGGYNVNKFAAVEVFAAKSVDESTTATPYGPVNFSIDKSYGGYLKGLYPVNEYFTPYVKVGVTNSTLKATVLGRSFTEDETSFSYGAGANIAITKQAYLTAGYTKLHQRDGSNTHAYNVNLGYKF